MYRLIGKGPAFRLLNRLPLAILVNPFGSLFSILCLASGLPLFFGHITPQSVEDLLPVWLARAWGASIVVGAFLQLLGGFMAHRRHVSLATTIFQKGQSIERIGLLILGYVAAIYGLCVIGIAGVPGLFAASIILAFAFICWIQAFLIRVKFTFAYDYFSRPDEKGWKAK